MVTNKHDASKRDIYYLYNDYQGSLIAVQKKGSTTLEQMSYDPWGRKRSGNKFLGFNLHNVFVPLVRLEQKVIEDYEKRFAFSNSDGVIVFGFVVEGPYGLGGLFGEGPEAGVVSIIQNLISAIPLVNIGNGISILQTGNDMFGNKQNKDIYAPFAIVTGVLPFFLPFGLQNMLNGLILDKAVENATKPKQ